MAPPRQVALLVTCLVDQVMPEVGLSTVRLLRRAGFSVAFPRAQTCCGQPFFNSGFRPQAMRLARQTIELFSRFDAVVLPSGSCTTMIRVEYPHLMAGNPGWHQRAADLASKTFELTEFLARFAPDFLPQEDGRARVTYHDSCHMCRTLGIASAPRALLVRAGYAVDEMSEPDRCCGFGGLFSVRMPGVANAMSEEKLRQAGESGAATLVTADPGCLMQMRGVARGRLKVVHIAELLAESLP